MQSAASEMGIRDLLDEDTSDQEVDLAERGLAEEGPASDHSDGL